MIMDWACRISPTTGECAGLALSTVLPETVLIVSLKIVKAIGGWDWTPVDWCGFASDGFKRLARVGRHCRLRPGQFAKTPMARSGSARRAMAWDAGGRELSPT